MKTESRIIELWNSFKCYLKVEKALDILPKNIQIFVHSCMCCHTKATHTRNH